MILLDENIIANQVELLRSWRIRVHRVHEAFGREGLSDSALVALMRRLGNTTFFTRDKDYFDSRLCHPKACFVWLDVGQGEVASFVRRTLRERTLRTRRARMGCVIRVAQVGITFGD
jgi:hypothetical protein